MLMEKPVITSDAKPLARIVKETECGEVFLSDSPEDFAAAILKVHGSRKPYGQKGRKAVEEKYNWDMTSRQLQNLYQEIGEKS